MRGILRSASLALLVGGAVIVGACGSADETTVADSTKKCGKVVENAGDVLPEPPDGASLCPADNVCNFQSQTGCNADQACRPVPSPDMSRIVASCQPAGSGEAGADCTSSNACATGYFCAAGQCRRLCCGQDWSDSACDPGDACYTELFMRPVAGEGVTPLPSGAYVCLPTGCNVLTSDECPSELDCKIIDPKGTTACILPSPEGLGEPCASPSICGRGLTCVGEPGAKTCRRLCSAEPCGTPACRTGEGACVHFNRDPPGVGECTPGWD